MNIREFIKHSKVLPFAAGFSLIIILLITTFSIFYFREKITALGTASTESYEKYEKHYAIITSNTDLPFWNSVYESAKAEAKKYNAYVEYMGKELTEVYDTQALLRIAIDCSVDGIIIEGNENPEMAELINEAVKKGIVVVTVLKDSPKSQRHSFVGVNNYKLGQTYGEQVLKICNDNTKRILVLMDSGRSGASQNMIYASIKETIQKGSPNNKLDIQNVMINSENTFSSEEAIRDIIMDTNNLPDIMICLSSIDTQCAYQAVVDYNKVGYINILGSYNLQDILIAVQKQIIHSTVSINTKQMGILCVQAINEYRTMGRVSDYFSVDTQLINLHNVNYYLAKEK